MLDLEFELAVDFMALDTAHVFDNEVGSKTLDLLTFVRGADGDHGSAGSDGGLDTGWGVFEDDRLLAVDSEVVGSEEEWVGEGLSTLQSWVIGCDADFWDGDAETSVFA